jgi:hypothetical protein
LIITALQSIVKIDNDAVKELRLHKLRNGQPFMINSKDLKCNQCFLEYPDGTIQLVFLLGLSHYLPLAAQKKIHLYGTTPLPLWLNKAAKDVRFIWHSEWDLLGTRRQEELSQGDPLKKFTRLQSWKDGKADLVLSSPERAFLEILADVPRDISFEHADQLMQGMTSLSPSLLQAVLQECRNVKVRRLFFLLADRHQHAWLKKMEPEKIDLGSGKRQLIVNGKLDKKYLITIPKTYES